MKRLYGILIILISLCLTGCMQKECNPKTKEVVRTVERIKKVEVPVIVEKYVEVPYYKDTEFRYKPGSYYKTKEADGFTYMVYLNVNKAGLIDNLFIDKTSLEPLLYLDEEANNLYVKVNGVKDIIPNTYRLVYENRLASIKDAIMDYDLVEGYPSHDKLISKLKEVNIHNTRRVNSLIYDDNWANEMDLVIEKILNDQTTNAIHMYNAATGTKTDNIRGVSINIGHEVELVNEILLFEASLPEDYVLAENIKKDQGLYKKGTYFNISTPTIKDGEIKYSTSLLMVDYDGKITDLYLDEYSSKAPSKRLSGDKEYLEYVKKLEDEVKLNQNASGVKVYDSNGKIIKLDLTIKNNEYETKAYLANREVNACLESLNKSLEEAYNNFNLSPGNFYYRTKEGYIYATIIRNIALEDNLALGITKGDIIKSSDYLKQVKHELKILGLSIDKILKTTPNYLKDGKEIEIYNYKKAYPFYTCSKDYELVPIYKYVGKDIYYYLEDNKSLEVVKDSKVKFNDKYFDEASTITSTRGFSTVMTTITNDESILKERALLKEISRKVVEENSLLSLVLESDNTLRGFDSKLDASKIIKDLRKLQMVSSNAINSATNVITPNISHTVNSLASGVYYSLDGKQDESRYGQMFVYNDEVVGLMFDKIIYYLDNDLNIFKSQVNDNLYDLASIIGSVKLNLDDLIKDYDYTKGSKINYDLALNLEGEAKDYELVIKDLVKASLDNKATTKINDTVKYLDEFMKDKFIVEGTSGSIVIPKKELNKHLLVALDASGVYHYLGIKFKPSNKVKVGETSEAYEFSYDKELVKDLDVTIDYELSYLDNKVIGSLKTKVLTTRSFQDYLLTYTKDDRSNLKGMIKNHEAIANGTKLNLKLLDELTSKLVKISDNKLKDLHVLLDLDNCNLVKDDITYHNKDVINLGSTNRDFIVKVNLVDDTKKGELNLKFFFDTENNDNVYGTYQKGEAFLDVNLEVLNNKQVKGLISTSDSLDGIINNITSEKPVKLVSSDDFKVMGVDINWTHEINGKTSLDEAKLDNDYFGFINEKTNEYHKDDYQVGDSYIVDLPIKGSVKLKLVSIYEVNGITLKTNEFNFVVKQGSTKEVEEVMKKAIKERIREVAKVYSSLEYRNLPSKDVIYYEGKSLNQVLSSFSNFDVINEIDGSEVQVTIDWLNENNLHVEDIGMTFEEAILRSLGDDLPKPDEIKKTKLVARSQYKIDEVNIVSYIDFDFNIYNNGIQEE